MRDSVVHHGSKLRVEPEDINAFADGAHTLLKSSNSREDIRAFTVERFGWVQQADKYLVLFNEITP